MDPGDWMNIGAGTLALEKIDCHFCGGKDVEQVRAFGGGVEVHMSGCIDVAYMQVC